MPLELLPHLRNLCCAGLPWRCFGGTRAACVTLAVEIAQLPWQRDLSCSVECARACDSSVHALILNNQKRSRVVHNPEKAISATSSQVGMSATCCLLLSCVSYRFSERRAKSTIAKTKKKNHKLVPIMAQIFFRQSQIQICHTLCQTCGFEGGKGDESKRH